MGLLSKFFKEIKTPDDQAGNWYAWASNQLSHAFLGATVATFSGSYWFVVTAILAMTKEGFDLSRAFSSSALKDSLTDIVFWILGAGFTAEPDYRIAFAVAIFVLATYGIIRRMKKKK